MNTINLWIELFRLFNAQSDLFIGYIYELSFAIIAIWTYYVNDYKF